MHAKITTRFVKSLIPQTKPYEIYDSELTGFLVRVQPSGHKSYYLFYRTPDGRKRQYRIGPADRLSVAQARDLAQQYAARTISGEDIQATKQHVRIEAQNAKIQTLAGFLEHKYSPWLLGERPEKRRSVEVLQRLQTNFTEWLERPLRDITPWLVEKWRAEQLKNGKAKATINRDLTTLRSVLSKAIAWEVIDEDPLESVKPLKVDSNGVIRFLSEEEEQRLRLTLVERDERIKTARTRGNDWRRTRGYSELPELDKQLYGDHLTPMVLLSLNTGVRRGELFALRWEDVNLQQKALTIRGSTTKSGQTRYIPLNQEAVYVLQMWRQQAPEGNFMFPGKTGQQFDNTRKSWDSVLTSGNIEHFRWHDLRHTFASKLVMAGIPLNTVRELLGHTTPAMTLRYAHLAPDHKAHAVEQITPSTFSVERRIQHG